MTDPGHTRRSALSAGASALLVALAGCLGGGESSTPTQAPTQSPVPTTMADDPTATTTDAAGTPTERPSWRELELTDAVTGEPFTIQQFEGQPVLLEFFAVWCPVCTAQQKAVREALGQQPDLVPISLNVDPNEGEARVREHVQTHDFGWRYAVSSSVMTHRLIQEFGSVIANPPSAPVVRVCPDGSASLLDERGVKPAETLLGSYDSC